MTYLNFLILFVITPSIVFGILFRRHLTRKWWAFIGLLSVIAVVWTTPWDNYLVANNVWWYNPQLVLGVVIGYVPLEEYSFFVLQTVFTGILLAGLLHLGRHTIRPYKPIPLYVRLLPMVALGIVTVWMLANHDPKFNYLILVLGWLAFIPLSIQWAFGLDMLLQRWKIMAAAVLLPTMWLTIMDSVAIGAGTWTIDPGQTVGILLPGGVVPIEEGIFFLITNMLIVQGLLLVAAPESLTRALYLRDRLFSLIQKPSLAAGEKTPNIR